MPAGRPSKYNSAMCEKVIACGREGMGKCEMAAELGITYTSFETYQDQHPEFLEAVKHALRLSQAWWEGKGRLATFGGTDGFNATSYIFNMKNRFKEDWRDRQLIGSDPENPLPAPAAIDASKLSSEALREILAARGETGGK